MRKKTLQEIFDQLSKDLMDAAVWEMEEFFSKFVKNFGIDPSQLTGMLRAGRPGWDPYRILGLEPGASLEEVRHRYLELAKILHPDVAGEATQELFKLVQAAYDEIRKRKGGVT